MLLYLYSYVLTVLNFLHLINLPFTKRIAHNSYLFFLLNYLRKKNHIYKIKEYLEIILGFFLEHISIF